MKRTGIGLALLLVGCGTKVEEKVCDTDDDCDEAYFCDAARHRCLRLACESTDDCADGYICETAIQRCVFLVDGGGTFCDRDRDGVNGPQCDGGDCDDHDETRSPDHAEICNGKDDDCDDATPEGTDADDDDFCAEGGPLPCCAEAEEDCCDTDADAKPGQTAWFSTASDCGDFDYDCNGSGELQPAGFGGCACVSSTCDQTPGWLGSVPGSCGATGDWVTGCVEVSCGTCTPETTPTAQGCH